MNTLPVTPHITRPTLRLELKTIGAADFDARPTLSFPGGDGSSVPPPMVTVSRPDADSVRRAHVTRRSSLHALVNVREPQADSPLHAATLSFSSFFQVTIATDELTLTYNSSIDSGDFTNRSITITLHSAVSARAVVESVDRVWRPGDNASGNLFGTRLDLGCYDTFDACYGNGLGWGPLSRDGWAVWDDTLAVRMQVAPDPDVGFPWFDGSVPCSSDGLCGPNERDW